MAKGSNKSKVIRSRAPQTTSANFRQSRVLTVIDRIFQDHHSKSLLELSKKKKTFIKQRYNYNLGSIEMFVVISK